MKQIIRLFRTLKKSFDPSQPLIEVRLSSSRLRGNLAAYRKQFPTIQFAPVLKSNAYGHGIVEVASILDAEEKAFFAVDSLFEATTLRHNGIHSKLLVIGYIRSDDIVATSIETSFILTSLEQLRQIETKLKKPTLFHLKIDTGMHRQGIMPSELSEALQIIKQNRLIELEGICSHFADADTEESALTNRQIDLWNTLVARCKEELPAIRYFHIAATAGTRYLEKIDCNVARLGIGLYGISTSPTALELKPVLSMQTVISSVRTIEPGETVGYNGTFVAKSPMRIATIPVGYFEGLDRRLSGKGMVLVNGIPCPIIGRVSMNISSIDVSSVPDVALNTPVTVMSNNPEHLNCVNKMAELAGTIPHEILIHIPAHLRRHVTNTP